MSKPMYGREYIRLRGDTAEDALSALGRHSKADIVAAAVNHVLNDFISGRTRGEHEPMDYQGWFWRGVDFFAAGGVTIADGDGRVAVCQNNKWGYPERDLTADEQTTFRGLVWDAYLASGRGGSLADINEAADTALAKASDYIASLDVPAEDW